MSKQGTRASEAHVCTQAGFVGDQLPNSGSAKPFVACKEMKQGSMIWIPGGDFIMGSNKFYIEERPARRESVMGFWMDPHLVSNAEFQAFVLDTAYLTVAQRVPEASMYPNADPALLVPGSAVFTKPSQPVGLRDHGAWWSYIPGADWLHPEGLGSTLEGRWDHPVVHVAFDDVTAYASWSGKMLPTETEWEFAARGGLEDSDYAWGEELTLGGRAMANTWQGRFPWENLAHDGYERTSPVGAFPPNPFGLYDMIGNVWEWTSSPYGSTRGDLDKPSCCQPKQVESDKTNRVVKGGSHLCAPNYCLRYRPAARQSQSVDTSTTHIGFRCILRPSESPSATAP